MKKLVLFLVILFSVSAQAQIIINPPVANLVVCDDNNDGFAWFDLSIQTPLITLGDPNLTVTYHGTLLNAENGILQSPNPYMNDRIYLDFPITDSQDPNYGTGGVWARVESSTSNEINIVPFALEVRSAPVGNAPAPLRKCDDAIADGLTIFDLTVFAAEVLGSLDPLGFDLYYFEDQNQAVLAGDLALTTNPDFSQAIPDPTNFLNAINPQYIYILLVSNANGIIPPNPNSAEGCYDIVELNIIVDAKPIANQPSDIVVCDDEIGGSLPNDGLSTFDLTVNNTIITGGDPTLIVSWYSTVIDMQNDIPIPDPTAYQNVISSIQEVYFRVSNPEGCSEVGSNLLIVNEIPPITQPNNLFINEGDGDGFAIFDLTVNIPVMLGGLNPSDYQVFFYLSFADAQNNTNPINNSMSYENTSNPQTIFVRVENLNTGCYAITSFEILTDELAPDADGDGIANEDEDINGNGNLNDDDTDGDGIPNYLDSDDDGDTVQTIDETTGIGAGVAPSYIYIDTDGDTIENYLDNDDDGDGTLTIDEDYNNNGNPIDDDTNANGIPDFLDDDVFLSVNSFGFEDLSIYPNPTSESFTVQSSQLVLETTISIFDIQGKLLSSENILPQNGKLTMDVSTFESGVYFMKISSEGNSAFKKVVKN